MASKWQLYNNAKKWIGEGANLPGGTFRMALFSPTHTPALTDVLYSGLANEIAAVDNGYTLGGELMTGLDWQESSGTAKWEAAAVTWTQVGANDIGPVQYAIIYDTSGSELICYTDFQSPETISGGSGAMLIVTPSAANGVFNISGGTGA